MNARYAFPHTAEMRHRGASALRYISEEGEEDEEMLPSHPPRPAPPSYAPLYFLGTVLGLGVVATIITLSVLGAQCKLNNCPAPSPSPSPSPSPANYIYVPFATESYVLASASYENETYVAFTWLDNGTIYHPTGEPHISLDSCVDVSTTGKCSIVVRVDTGLNQVTMVLMYKDMIVQKLYAYDPVYLLVMGQGLVSDGFVIPEENNSTAAVVNRAYASLGGISIMYARDGPGGPMLYYASSIVEPGDYVSAPTSWPDEQLLWITDGDFTASLFAFAFHGSCTGQWHISDFIRDHDETTAAAGDSYVQCEHHQAAVVLYGALGAPYALWYTASPAGIITANFKSTDLDYFVYGSYTSDPVEYGGDFIMPTWAYYAGPVVWPSVSSPPGASIPWTTGDIPTGYLIRYTLGEGASFAAYTKFETTSRHFEASIDVDTITVFGETEAYDTMTVYNMSSTADAPVGTITNDSPENSNVIGCTWDLGTGVLTRCIMWGGSATTFVAAAWPFLISVTSDGEVVSSQDWTPGTGDPPFNYTDMVPLSFTGVSLGYAKGAYDSTDVMTPLLTYDATGNTEMLARPLTDQGNNVWLSTPQGVQLVRIGIDPW